MSTTAIIVAVAGGRYEYTVETEAPLGWRFWTFAGFPKDPVEPRPYGGSRGVPLAFCDHFNRWLVAMELDGSAQLVSTHSMFPCADQEGAAAFTASWIARHTKQADLFDQA